MDLGETFSWEGRRIAWGRAGSGPAVAFCHGTPWSSWLWQPFAEALSADFSVYLWDMPGYGRSSKEPAHPVDFGAQAGAFTALLAHWGLERPHVVAHDYGGAVSLRAHLVHEVPYASLLLAESWRSHRRGRRSSGWCSSTRTCSRRCRRTSTRRWSGRTSAARATASCARATSPRSSRRGWARRVSRRSTGRSPSSTSATSPRTRPCSGIEIPVTVVWGTEDTWLPMATGERVAAGIRGAGLTPVEGAGHLIQLDAPVALATALRTWLASVTA